MVKSSCLKVLTDWLDEEDAMTSLESEAKKRPKRAKSKRDGRIGTKIGSETTKKTLKGNKDVEIYTLKLTKMYLKQWASDEVRFGVATVFGSVPS